MGSKDAAEAAGADADVSGAGSDAGAGAAASGVFFCPSPSAVFLSLPALLSFSLDFRSRLERPFPPRPESEKKYVNSHAC